MSRVPGAGCIALGYRWYRDRGTTLHNPKGISLRVAGLLADITTEKSGILQAQQIAETAAASTEFAASAESISTGARHQIRTKKSQPSSRRSRTTQRRLRTRSSGARWNKAAHQVDEIIAQVAAASQQQLVTSKGLAESTEVINGITQTNERSIAEMVGGSVNIGRIIQDLSVSLTSEGETPHKNHEQKSDKWYPKPRLQIVA